VDGDADVDGIRTRMWTGMRTRMWTGRGCGRDTDTDVDGDADTDVDGTRMWTGYGHGCGRGRGCRHGYDADSDEPVNSYRDLRGSPAAMRIGRRCDRNRRF